MTSDTSERGLGLICTALTGAPCDPTRLPDEDPLRAFASSRDADSPSGMRERPASYSAGWIGGDPDDYDREYCVDLAQFRASTARIEHDKALARTMTAVLKDDTELFKQFMDNESFRRWMTDTVFGLTYDQPAT
jgi:hypothetical protein